METAVAIFACLQDVLDDLPFRDIRADADHGNRLAGLVADQRGVEVDEHGRAIRPVIDDLATPGAEAAGRLGDLVLRRIGLRAVAVDGDVAPSRCSFGEASASAFARLT
jgi:hypothetical protein